MHTEPEDGTRSAETPAEGTHATATRRSDGGSTDGDRTDDPAAAAHLERSRKVWDRWSDYYAMSERDFEPMREAAIDRLGLEPGDRVLEIGCGPGVNFEALRAAVGESGSIVAVDYSPAMVSKARDRIDEHGWENVEVRLADATTVDLEGEFDAAVATLSLGIMPDVRRAVENVHDSLAPGRPFVVIGLRAIPEGPARIANPFVVRFFRWYANWRPEADVLETLSSVYDECEVVDDALLGVAYTALCRKTADEGD
ncbi:class I SAM-dependent methyltransferase [Natrarchaeobius oligotrophus]|uniref:Class I SAM-dependent methyltransferase n=1 Tax=Natrarchaeobius chitinivorans TaxID=1679083 RepID=A0A3N6MSS1_NATCH|nr:class I SAM-dependent methyltransferase [Natrarchaeobius chitinivorans]RQH00871.1 class I SAM-dependent methyltransferase [Natrarchaeobius chitinivorans]